MDKATTALIDADVRNEIRNLERMKTEFVAIALSTVTTWVGVVRS